MDWNESPPGSPTPRIRPARKQSVASNAPPPDKDALKRHGSQCQGIGTASVRMATTRLRFSLKGCQKIADGKQRAAIGKRRPQAAWLPTSGMRHGIGPHGHHGAAFQPERLPENSRWQATRRHRKTSKMRLHAEQVWQKPRSLATHPATMRIAIFPAPMHVAPSSRDIHHGEHEAERRPQAA